MSADNYTAAVALLWWSANSTDKTLHGMLQEPLGKIRAGRITPEPFAVLRRGSASRRVASRQP